MITEMLARLKELDATTYDKIMEGIPMRTRMPVWAHEGAQGMELYTRYNVLSHAAQDAWLQWCLQEAITARKWTQDITGISCDEYTWIAYIHFHNAGREFVRSGWMDSPASAILDAYIAALEAKP